VTDKGKIGTSSWETRATRLSYITLWQIKL
jgi:hypothetical protein